MISSALAGFATSIALIAVIGSQNAFVLRQGLRREYVVPVVVTCAASDALLISAGIAGLGELLTRHPAVVVVIRWGGAAFLLCYAVLAARRALRPSALTPTVQGSAAFRATILACLAFTYLNPHVYLDTVLLVGGVANQHAYPWLFGAGSVLASVVWFTALGAGAHRLAPLLARPMAWRILDAVVAAMTATIAATLILQ
ncbi:LysE/ArgO family amino acid transporter [Actinopolymorpha alba]|uniref:LysE/ArgO family amino acid transporter n=1 Tax=Actinopolymorpha alba TaxID=533267 RepID=UPI00038005B7|nr:LysE/ArgO family amino acid transporter [Actinopolymorpha alba]